MTSPSEETKLAVIARDISYIQTDVKTIKDTMQSGYVSKDEFAPVKRIAYGLMSAMVAIAIAIIIFLLQKAFTK